MRDPLSAVLWRLAVFVSVCLLGLFVLVAVFAQLRFEPMRGYTAEFKNVGGLKEGDIIRIAGVEVGKVGSIAIRPDAVVAVDLNVEDSVQLTDTTRSVIRFDNLYGDRYLTLIEGENGGTPLQPGATIPISRTAPALDLDTLIGGFRPLFRALDPEQVNALSSQLIHAFQGQGDAIGSMFAQTAALTNTLADRDELIGQVITNLNTVLSTFQENNEEFGQAIDEIASLTEALAERKGDISNSIAYADRAAESVADLLDQSRPALQKITNETDRTTSIVLNEHDYLDNLLDTLPDAYQILGRQGLYGDWFAFYVCEVVLKVNGKGGQPVYIKAAGQSTGRCTPK